MTVTKKMIGAAHDVLLKKGDFVLSADLLERIYLAMDALANHNETSGSLFQMQEAAKEIEALLKAADYGERNGNAGLLPCELRLMAGEVKP